MKQSKLENLRKNFQTKLRYGRNEARNYLVLTKPKLLIWVEWIVGYQKFAVDLDLNHLLTASMI